MNRYIAAIVVGMSLSATYGLYARIVLPMTQMTSQPAPPPLSGQGDWDAPIFVEVSESHFPDVPWTRDADIKWQRSEHAFLYTNKIERLAETGNVVRFSPLAMMWRDPKHPEAAPFRLIAQTALIEFENQFFDSAIDLTNASPGHIVWSALDGEVHMDGPDGLVIDGRTFKFSEQNASLYSDEDLSFAFGPSPEDQTSVRGHAHAISISFVPSPEAVLGRDLPRVGGVSSIVLRQNVDLQLAFVRDGSPARARLRSSGPFEYDVDKQTATFQDSVKVEHWAQKKGRTLKDELLCAWLGLQFEKEQIDPQEAPKEQNSNPYENLFDGLTFRKMQASGDRHSKVSLTSQEQDVVASMQDLTYDAIQRIAVMQDDTEVNITRGDINFRSPSILFAHTEENDVERMTCTGAGRLLVRNTKRDAPPLEATWTDRLDVTPEPHSKNHVVHVQGGTEFLLPGRLGLASDSLKCWVDMDRAQNADSESDLSSQPLNEVLPISRVMASGHVSMVSEKLVVRKSNSVDVRIAQGQLPPEPEKRGGVVTASGQQSQKETQGKPWIVDSENLVVNLTQDVQQGRIDVKRVEGVGRVRLVNDDERLKSNERFQTDGPLELSGVQLIAENSGGNSQTVSLLGQVNDKGDIVKPAVATLGKATFAGANIVVVRDQNVVGVNGPGKFWFQIPPKEGADASEEPATLEVVWQKKMTFDGGIAKFLGSVNCRMDREGTISRLDSKELHVHLNQRIAFEERRAANQKIDVSKIVALEDVEFNAHQFEGTKPVGVHSGHLNQIEFSPVSGDFVGQGPGVIEAWTFGSKVRFAPDGAAQANQPLNAEKTRWRYTKISFFNIVGNSNTGYAELKGNRVNLFSAPVDHARETFAPERMAEESDQAANCIRLECDRLRVNRKESAASKERDFVEIMAYQNVELEGQKFRAVASELTFDEEVERFVLRGLGDPATLYFRRFPNQQAESSSHQLIEFIPAKGYVSVDGSSGLSGGF